MKVSKIKETLKEKTSFLGQLINSIFFEMLEKDTTKAIKFCLTSLVCLHVLKTKKLPSLNFEG